MPHVMIRRAMRADESRILELALRLVAFGPPPWRDVEEMRATDRRVLSDALKATAPDVAVLVAEASETAVAGFIHPHSAIDYYTQRSHGHVADVIVAAEYEGQGIARLLLTVGGELGQG
jgi:ribosomal protein S18 acetylase RimI-like enzyme